MLGSGYYTWQFNLNMHIAWTFFLVLSGFLFINSQQAYAEVNISNDFSYTYNDITGPGKNQSSLTDGFRYLNILRLNGTGQLGDFDYYFNIGSQLTDDRRIDPQTFLLTNLMAEVSRDAHTVTVGDTFQAFSQYGLSTSLKGSSYRFSSESFGLPEVTFIYGFASPRWDNFHGFGESQIDTIDREVVGGKVQYSIMDDLTAGFSVVRTDDSDRVNSTDELYDIVSYTLDWEYNPIPGLTIDGESSFADTTLSPGSTTPDEEMDGYANKITAIGDGGPSRVKLEYERIDPDYKTVVGSATSDREKVKVKWRYKYARLNTVTSEFLWYRNNLDGRLDITKDHYRPEISLQRRKMLGRKYASAEVSYKFDITKENNASTTRTDHIVNLNYRDRFGIIDSDSNIGFSVYDFKSPPRRKSLEYIYNTLLYTRFYRDGYTLKPTLTLGGWTFREELSGVTDRIYEYSLGTGLDIPAWNITSNIKIGQNKLQKESSTDSMKAFARLDIFYRPQLISKLKYSMIFLRSYINDYGYDFAGSDFRETSITTGLRMRF